MSAVAQRREIIAINIPKLIQNITGFERNCEKFKRCEEFAHRILRNHRNLSVNSNEITRRVEGLQEKLRVNNYKIYGDHLQKLVDGIVNHPICRNHYETDVGWAIIDFLFCLAYNPVGALRENKKKISLEIVTDFDEEQNEEEYNLSTILREDFIAIEPLTSNYSDSELSEWTESDENETENQTKISDVTKESDKDILVLPKVKIFPGGEELRPPEKAKHYVVLDQAKAKNWLHQNCQNSWWINFQSEYKINSDYENANFAKKWHEFILGNLTSTMTQPISTESEYRLMREIIWMLYSPRSCKFFVIDDSGNVSIRKNTTLPSATVDGLKTYLQSCFVPAIHQHMELRKFIDSIYSFNNRPIVPKTYECYAACLKDLLEPYYEKILQIEKYIKDQLPATITTIIQIRQQLDNIFKYIEKIYKIHQEVILDLNKYPAHIISTYMLSSLIYCFQEANNLESSNIAITLFMFSCRTFCDIMNILWSQGVLEDWRHEFVVEKYNNEIENLGVRLFEKCREKSFYVAPVISKRIKDSNFIKLLINHVVEAGYTLNFLFEIDKISYLRNASHFDEDLFDQFFDEFISSVKNYETSDDPDVKQENELIQSLLLDREKTLMENSIHSIIPFGLNASGNFEGDAAIGGQLTASCDSSNSTGGLSRETCEALYKYEMEQNNVKKSQNIDYHDKVKKSDYKNFLTECAAVDDEFLVMAYSNIYNLDISNDMDVEPETDSKNESGVVSLQKLCVEQNKEKKENVENVIKIKNGKQLLEKLNNSSGSILPLEEIILELIAKILSYRISFTNSFVMKMFREDFNIARHFQNIRKVLLLEAGDVMLFYYQKLFHAIENEEQWANPFLLTVTLDDILTAKFPDMSLLFKVDIASQFKSKTTRVVDAVEQIVISYNVRKEIKSIFTEEIMKAYNDVFHFLLKLKWAIWTLENLSFARASKKRPPYATYRLIDLNMRQLEQLRLWMLYSLHCIHSHIMTAVLHSMGNQLDEKICKCSNLAELKSIHKSYVKTIMEQCLLVSQFETVKAGIEQLFSLTFIIREQWKCCVKKLDSEYIDDEDEIDATLDSSTTSAEPGQDDHIKSIEETYVKCHEYLAKMLNIEVYWNQKDFLSPLLAAFKSSLPC